MNSLFHLAAPEWVLLKDPNRLQALKACGIFATRPESEFDDIVSLAALSCQCSSAMIAFADADNLHFKSTVGANKGLLQKIADNFFIPTVQHSEHIWCNDAPNDGTEASPDSLNFFAGVPLRAVNDHIIGVLCVTDPDARKVARFHAQALHALGRQTEHQLTLRRMISEQAQLIKQRETDLEIRRRSETELASALSRVSLINEIGRTARSGDDPAIILETAVAKLGASLSADRCYLVTYNPEENTATIGPDWHARGLKPISSTYKISQYAYTLDSPYLSNQSAVIDDVQLSPHYRASFVSIELGIRAVLRTPILQGGGLTALAVAMQTPRKWTSDEVSLVEAIAAQTRAAVETARHIQRERALLRDVLASVTEGKLILADAKAQLPHQFETIGAPVVLNRECGLAELRELIREAGRLTGHSEIRTFDTMTASSEAGMNAIVHAERGVASVSISSNNTVQVRIEDRGTGIAFDDLPKATLARGYSTKSTLGHGLKMMLETIDRLFLLTGPTGTTVVLEQEKNEPAPLWLAKHHSK